MSVNFTSELNSQQRQAAETLDGPLLILAGAGSGKTRVLTYRVANLIVQKKASPEQILAVTFTNKAAREMEARIYHVLSQMGVPLMEKLWVSTFHSTCARILREELHLLGYQPGWGIYDSSEQLSLLKKVLLSMGIKEKEFPAKAIQGRINQAKTLGLEPQQVDAYPAFLMDQQSLEVYFKYEEEMRKANCLDFGDLLLKTHILFKNHPEVLDHYRNRFKYIMVDEYQDTNRIQYLIVQRLASAHQNLCVVGDEDQSIYSWRGADIKNILDFEKDFPNAKTVKLEKNYRSSQNIVEAAKEVIANNNERKDKSLFTDNAHGEKITLREESNEYEEARYVVKQIQKRVDAADFLYSEIAVFYRTNAQSRVLEEQLRSYSIPYRLIGGIKFYERKEIKDVLSYMKLLINSSDDIAFKRAVNTPSRGIGKTTLQKIEALADEHKVPMLEATTMILQGSSVHSGAKKKLSGFLELVKNLQENASQFSLTELYQHILEESQYVAKLKAEDNPEADARIGNLEEFYNAIEQFENERDDEGTLIRFLEEMALVSDADDLDDEKSAVTLMTLHISKGLEYPCVFIVGMEEGLFPSGQSFNQADDSRMEEERRLCYVGMTRAEKKLYLTHARKRRVWGQDQINPPSRFLSEIPEQYIETSGTFKRPRFMDRHNSDFDSHSFSNDNHSSNSNDPFPNYDDVFDDSRSDDFSHEFDQELKGYSRGMRVRHPTYGMGSIFKVEGNGEAQKVSVLFTNKTVKKFVAKFARLEVMT